MSCRNSWEASPEKRSELSENGAGGRPGTGQVLQDLGGGQGQEPGFYSEQTKKAAERFQAGELRDLVAVRRSRAGFEIVKRVSAVFVGQKWPNAGSFVRFRLRLSLKTKAMSKQGCDARDHPATTLVTSKRESWTMAAKLGRETEPLRKPKVGTQRRGSHCVPAGHTGHRK